MKFVALTQTKVNDRPSPKGILVRSDLVAHLKAEGSGTKFQYITERFKSFGNTISVSEAITPTRAALSAAQGGQLSSLTLTSAEVLEINGAPYTGGDITVSVDQVLKAENTTNSQCLLWVRTRTGAETYSGFVTVYKLDLEVSDVSTRLNP